jgi:hypothetical protein
MLKLNKEDLRHTQILITINSSKMIQIIDLKMMTFGVNQTNLLNTHLKENNRLINFKDHLSIPLPTKEIIIHWFHLNPKTVGWIRLYIKKSQEDLMRSMMN